MRLGASHALAPVASSGRVFDLASSRRVFGLALTTQKKSAWKALKMQAGRLRSQWVILFLRAHSPQSFPVALEFRRVGVGHRWRITADADAAELQGPW